jgi:hypothetical protein
MDIAVDVDLSEQYEFRLLNTKTGKFVSTVGEPNVPRFVDTWQEASYYEVDGVTDEHSIEFQWHWFMVECECEWLALEDKADYRVHVVRGESGL